MSINLEVIGFLIVANLVLMTRMTLSELAEKYSKIRESIDNLSMDILMEAIYNERYLASTVGVLHQH